MGDCSHVITSFDGTFPHALGMTRAAVEPHEPMGWDAVGALAVILGSLAGGGEEIGRMAAASRRAGRRDAAARIVEECTGFLDAQGR